MWPQAKLAKPKPPPTPEKDPYHGLGKAKCFKALYESKAKTCRICKQTSHDFEMAYASSPSSVARREIRAPVELRPAVLVEGLRLSVFLLLLLPPPPLPHSPTSLSPPGWADGWLGRWWVSGWACDAGVGGTTWRGEVDGSEVPRESIIGRQGGRDVEMGPG